VVMKGEQLPAHSHWQGTPLVPCFVNVKEIMQLLPTLQVVVDADVSQQDKGERWSRVSSLLGPKTKDDESLTAPLLLREVTNFSHENEKQREISDQEYKYKKYEDSNEEYKFKKVGTPDQEYQRVSFKLGAEKEKLQRSTSIWSRFSSFLGPKTIDSRSLQAPLLLQEITNFSHEDEKQREISDQEYHRF